MENRINGLAPAQPPTCGACLFWLRLQQAGPALVGQAVGECRFLPPQLMWTPQGIQSMYVQTGSQVPACAQFRPTQKHTTPTTPPPLAN